MMPSLREQLAKAREDVVQAQKRIEEQVILIERLKSGGYNTEAAERLLATFIDLMSTLTFHRDGLERAAEERAKKGAKVKG